MGLEREPRPFRDLFPCSLLDFTFIALIVSPYVIIAYNNRTYEGCNRK